jgi:hypothetical protein
MLFNLERQPMGVKGIAGDLSSLEQCTILTCVCYINNFLRQFICVLLSHANVTTCTC